MPADRKAAAVSITVDLYQKSKARSKALGFTTWSAYVVQLIRQDLQSGGDLHVKEDAPVYQVAKKIGLGGAVTSPPEVQSPARF